LYLNAVQGLSSLVDVFGKQVVGRLLEVYTGAKDRQRFACALDNLHQGFADPQPLVEFALPSLASPDRPRFARMKLMEVEAQPTISYRHSCSFSEFRRCRYRFEPDPQPLVEFALPSLASPDRPRFAVSFPRAGVDFEQVLDRSTALLSTDPALLPAVLDIFVQAIEEEDSFLPCARTGRSGSCKSLRASRYLAREAASGSAESS
jgi:hypothetical protein